ncbi:substrate-binding periplasmic protein [Alteromonas facilis]|uniref:substrate-binding periplasmic protein n=1 Tax=Alteromonas facilis TaxID=2048004 RepID=UPI000C29183D|nr:transporter substrate-binding domain-containing protein [Alteromonas facilis]
MKSILFTFATLLFFAQSAVAATTPDRLKVCLMDSDLFPLWRKPGQENHPHPGINIELQQHLARQLGQSIEWVRAPFPRCLVLLKQNEVDLLNVASFSADREQYGHYPKLNGSIDPKRRLKSDAYHAYVLESGHVSWNGMEFSHLSNKPIAIEIGASIRRFLNERNIPVYEVSRVSQAFGMLRLGRVSAVVTNKFNGLSFTNSGVIELPQEVNSKAYYIMISDGFISQYPEYAEQIWAQSGETRRAIYNDLLEKYGRLEGWP